MHLTLFNILKTILVGSYRKKVEGKILNNDDHSYIRGDIENRGPCPGLNALANQGYLPRDGKNLTLPMVQHALETALHMSPLAAGSLTAALPGLCREDGTFDLVDTRRHNVIEHDSSFTRLDFHQGDNYTFQQYMLDDLIEDAAGGDVNLHSMAKTFIRRNKESRAAGAPKLSLNLYFVRMLQYVGAINTAQLGGKLPKDVLDDLFVKEKFSDAILQNPKPRTVLTLLGNALGMMRYVVLGP